MVHYICVYMCRWEIKICDPLTSQAIRKRYRGIVPSVKVAILSVLNIYMFMKVNKSKKTTQTFYLSSQV